MCGLYGVYYYGENPNQQNLEKLVADLGRAAAVRGTDATGIAYPLDDHKIMIDKQGVSAYQFKFNIPAKVKVVMGHTRAATKGAPSKNYNNHPFPGYAGKNRTPFALAHNGVLDNPNELQVDLPKTQVETDSYVAVQLLEKYGKVNMKTIKQMAETVIGSFVFTILDNKQNLYVVKNDNPFIIAHFKTLQLYAYASTKDILLNALIEYTPTKSIITDILEGKEKASIIEWIEPVEGEILKITPAGKIKSAIFKPKERIRYTRWYDYCYNWRDYGKRDTATTEDVTVFDIYTMAEQLGYAKEDIDFMLDAGYTTYELWTYIESGEFEDILYQEYLYWFGEDNAEAIRLYYAKQGKGQQGGESPQGA